MDPDFTHDLQNFRTLYCPKDKISALPWKVFEVLNPAKLQTQKPFSFLYVNLSLYCLRPQAAEFLHELCCQNTHFLSYSIKRFETIGHKAV